MLLFVALFHYIDSGLVWKCASYPIPQVDWEEGGQRWARV